MRYSHQRELILREVLSRSDYPTAEQICTSLRAVCPRLSLGTVYRDLNTLVDIGKVRRVFPSPAKQTVLRARRRIISSCIAAAAKK